jgi:hypothetical protein
MSVNDQVAFPLTENLSVIRGKFPKTVDAPDGAVVMIRTGHSGRITMSQHDWDMLTLFCKAGTIGE